MVDAGKPKFLRAYSWLGLVRKWTSMRSDDAQGIDLQRLLLTATCLKGVLVQTKTTGPGKKTLEVPFYVLRTATLANVPWLEVGWEIWNSADFKFKREFFVMHPTRDF